MIFCTACEKEWAIPNWPMLYVLAKDKVIENYFDVLSEPVWCYGCNAGSIAEVIPTILEFENYLSLAKAGNEIEPTCYRDQIFSNLCVKSYDDYFKIVSQNRKARCLKCGSDDTDNSPKKHPGCPNDGDLKMSLQISGATYAPGYLGEAYSLDGMSLGTLMKTDDVLKVVKDA